MVLIVQSPLTLWKFHFRFKVFFNFGPKRPSSSKFQKGALATTTTTTRTTSKKQQVWYAKQEFCTCSTLRRLTLFEHDVKFPRATCYAGREHTTTNFSFSLFLKLSAVPNSSPLGKCLTFLASWSKHN